MTKPAGKRPRIGLVLAGGNAYGLVHVGVIRWLEQNHIPIDVIAGTSMGALIGGMYASGKSGDEIEDFVSHANWDEAFSSTSPYRELNFRRKQDQRDLNNGLELGWKKGMRMPAGLNAGQGVGLMLSSFAGPYGDMPSFDQLPTPFRCVATDIVKARPVTFDSGSLTDALRASMSLPGLFSPVRIGNMVLVDGALLNNVPVDAAKAMGADIIIAVALNTPPPDNDKLSSLLGIAAQSLSVMIADNERRSLRNADLILAPDISTISATNYSQSAIAMQKGYDEAQRKAALLKGLAVSDEEWQEYEAHRTQLRRKLEPPARAAVRGEDPGKVSLQEAQSFVGTQPTVSALNLSLNRLAGEGYYSSTRWEEIYDQGEGGPTLRFDVLKKLYRPPYINVGLSVDGSDLNDIRLAAGMRVTLVPNEKTEWRLDGGVGRVNHASAEYYFRPTGGDWFIAPHVFFSSAIQPYYQSNYHLADYQFRYGGGTFDVGRRFGRIAEARLGYTIGYQHTTVTSGPPVGNIVKGVTNRIGARFILDRADSPTLMLEGFRINAEMSGVLTDPDKPGPYPLLDAEMSFAHRLSKKYVLLSSMRGGSTFGGNPSIDPFLLGGPGELSSLAIQQLRGTNYYSAQITGLRQLSHDPLGILNAVYIGLGYEMGDAFTDLNDRNTYNDGAIGIIGDTKFGALEVGFSVGETGNTRGYFRLGRVF